MPPGGVGALMMAGMVEGEGVKVSEDDARRELCIAARQYRTRHFKSSSGSSSSTE